MRIAAVATTVRIAENKTLLCEAYLMLTLLIYLNFYLSKPTCLGIGCLETANTCIYHVRLPLLSESSDSKPIVRCLLVSAQMSFRKSIGLSDHVTVQLFHPTWLLRTTLFPC